VIDHLERVGVNLECPHTCIRPPYQLLRTCPEDRLYL
jgi:hypothetical protein